jgi:hypothetical protein
LSGALSQQSSGAPAVSPLREWPCSSFRGKLIFAPPRPAFFLSFFFNLPPPSSLLNQLSSFFFGPVGKHNVCSFLYPFFPPATGWRESLSPKDFQLTLFVSPSRNSTVLSSATYWGQYEEITKFNTDLNIAERLWAAWYAWMQNDVLATGIMSFMIHELVYFGRSLPWVFIDTLGFFKSYKIQNVSWEPIPRVNDALLTLVFPSLEQDPLIEGTVGLRQIRSS